MKPFTWRAAVWAIFIVAAVLRPGIDLLDRWLARASWNIPSEWNAVADVMLQTGVVDGHIDGRLMPWRQASVLPVGPSRVAIITVSDLARARVTFLTEDYRTIGVLARTTAEPSLVTDEARGYKGLSHIWPLIEEEGRLHTLIAMAPLRSDPVKLGTFAYVALGAQENEILWVCRLEFGPGPTWGELVRRDLNGDGFDDFIVYQKGDPAAPIASFIFDGQSRTYKPTLAAAGRELVSWWSSSPSERVVVPREVPLDDAVRRIAAGFDNHGRTVAAAGDARQKAAWAATF